jgi:hypothetical protein
MDIAAAGAAAIQLSNAQRAQQISVASMRQAKVQGQTLANLLAQASGIEPTATPAQAGAVSAAAGGGATAPQISGDTPPNPNLPRGSLVNILV